MYVKEIYIHAKETNKHVKRRTNVRTGKRRLFAHSRYVTYAKETYIRAKETSTHAKRGCKLTAGMSFVLLCMQKRRT